MISILFRYQRQFVHLYLDWSGSEDGIVTLQLQRHIAALDYIVCLLSETFMTIEGENFPHFLMATVDFYMVGMQRPSDPTNKNLLLCCQESANVLDQNLLQS